MISFTACDTDSLVADDDTDETLDLERLDELATEYAQAFRAGTAPPINEYAALFPDLGPQILELFPIIGALEGWKLEHSAGGTPANEPNLSAASHFGPYQVLREIGRGGMGVVYEAEESTSGRHVALKLVTAPDYVAAHPSRGTKHEAVIAAGLNHSNIVPIYASGEENGQHYYVMKLIRGVNLGQVIEWWRTDADGVSPSRITARFEGREPESADAPATRDVRTTGKGFKPLRRDQWGGIAKIVLQLADAVRHAHREGVLHRDIKPANVVLDEDGTVWVTDFGLALPTLMATTGRLAAGTVRYMAPEQFDGTIDVRTDVYAIGVTLYELCTLRHAFAAEDRRELKQLIQLGRSARPRSIQRSIPMDLERIILKAMAVDPRRRYQTVNDLMNDLKRFVKTYRHKPEWWRRWLPVW